jgi:cytochrome c biogenesis protein CcmG, thiol:disulfide interchange protein DsbE
MKKVKLLLLLCAFAATTAMAQKALPNVAVKTLNGEQVLLAEVVNNDKITIISFWATWCKPCKLELDNLADFYEDWQKDYNVEIIAVTIDDARQIAKVQPLVDSKGWTYRIFSDMNRDLHKAVGGTEIPYTVIVKGGEILYTHSGYKLGDEEGLEEKIKGWAATSEPAAPQQTESNNAETGSKD